MISKREYLNVRKIAHIPGKTTDMRLDKMKLLSFTYDLLVDLVVPHQVAPVISKFMNKFKES